MNGHPFAVGSGGGVAAGAAVCDGLGDGEAATGRSVAGGSDPKPDAEGDTEGVGPGVIVAAVAHAATSETAMLSETRRFTVNILNGGASAV